MGFTGYWHCSLPFKEHKHYTFYRHMMALPKWEPNLGTKCELKDNKREQAWPGTGINDVRNK